MKAARLSVLFVLCLAAAGPAFASGPGTSAANFLKIPVGARETSLGGAFTAATDNANAVFYNPAGLSLLESGEVSYSYNNYLSGVSQQWLSAAFPSGKGAFGFGANYLSVRAFDSYDGADNRTGSVSAYDLAAYAGYGSRLETGSDLVPFLRYGAAVKYISEGLDTRRSSGYGFDAGLLFHTSSRNLRFGLGVENLAASRLAFIRSGARPPLKLKSGVSYALRSPGGALGALFSLDVNYPEDGPRYLSAGVENTIYGALSLRAGYSSFGDVSNGLTFGLGLGLPRRGGRDIRLDYSYGVSYDLGNIHKFGLAWKFDADRAAAVPESRAAAAPQAVPAPPAAGKDQATGPDAAFKRQLELLYGDNPEDSFAAAEALAGMDKPIVVEHFSALLSSGKIGWKLAAVRGFSLLKDAGALAALAGALDDENEEVRRQAAVGLGSRGGAGAAAILQNALKKEESDSVKSSIMEALGKLAPGPQE